MGGSSNGGHGWVALSYFFLGALLGLVVTTVATVVAVGSLVVGGGEVVGASAMAALVGAVVLYTHLNEGLKRSRMVEQMTAASPPSGASTTQPSPPPPPAASVDRPPLWPGAVYFRVAALIGLIAAVSGAVGMCDAIASELFGKDSVPDAFSGYPGVTTNGQNLLRGLLVTGVGLLIMWWHLGEARKREQ